ncbi:MAG: hypothetical protein AB3N16_09625 [Flavobacteriaceae bacterium]
MSTLYMQGFSQSVNLDNLGKEKLLRYNGGVSANTVFYEGASNRQPFTYFLNGNLNFNIAGLYNVPLSFTYSNQDFDFPNPFKFNRLSLNPSYKWVAAHIGDASMTFSPYTLSGHQFTGGGIDLTPEGPFQISAMYGRLLRATKYNPEEPNAITAYKRTGYGARATYDFGRANLGLIFFKASEEEDSTENLFPIELGLTPKDNAVLSLVSEVNLFEKAMFRVEYAISGVTEDTRLTDPRGKAGLLSFLLDENISTNYYNALNASLNYPAGNGVLGVGYERVDPDYRTLGAYFFNNDLENITVNASQTLLDNKLNVSVNAGLQQDNLDKSKSSELQRIVSAVNLNYTASERLGINGSYSNFQSYTNIRDQFDYINQVGEFDNVDTLNYRQISQNATLGLNYQVKNTEAKQHAANLNLIYQNSDNQQDGETTENGTNAFYNSSLSYTLGYPQQKLTISLAANASYNSIGSTDTNLTLGPTMVVGKQFFDQRLRTNFSSSYNTSFTNGNQQNQVYNFRLGGNYTLLERHNLSLNILNLLRTASGDQNNDLTVTFGYSYAFDNLKLKVPKRERVPNFSEDQISFRYRGVVYSGTVPELNTQLTNVYNGPQFAGIPPFKRSELHLLLATVKEQDKKEPYVENALTFLKALYGYGDFLEIYDKALFAVIEKIKGNMIRIDQQLEAQFVGKKLELDAHPLHKKGTTEPVSARAQSEYEKLQEALRERMEKLVGHRWMEAQFSSFNDMTSVTQPKGYFIDFKNNMTIHSYKMYDKEPDSEKLELFLEEEIIDFYYKKSLLVVNPETFELKYINKQ